MTDAIHQALRSLYAIMELRLVDFSGKLEDGVYPRGFIPFVYSARGELPFAQFRLIRKDIRVALYTSDSCLNTAVELITPLNLKRKKEDGGYHGTFCKQDQEFIQAGVLDDYLMAYTADRTAFVPAYLFNRITGRWKGYPNAEVRAVMRDVLKQAFAHLKSSWAYYLKPLQLYKFFTEAMRSLCLVISVMGIRYNCKFKFAFNRSKDDSTNIFISGVPRSTFSAVVFSQRFDWNPDVYTPLSAGTELGHVYDVNPRGEQRKKVALWYQLREVGEYFHQRNKDMMYDKEFPSLDVKADKSKKAKNSKKK